MKAAENEFDFEVAYYPFELNPDMPVEGRNQKEFFKQKFGGAHEEMTERVSHVAAQEGLEFDFEKQHVSPNTRDAHRLVLFARDSGKDLFLVEKLFKAYFTDGVDLSKKENLTKLAVEVGLDEAEVARFLEGEAGKTEVVLAESEMQRIGVRGVPFYIINDKYGVSGAQPAEAFIDVFKGIAQEQETEAASCDVESGEC